jgi:hypothetical protein
LDALSDDASKVPERHRPLLRRLQQMIAELELVEATAVEDEALEDLSSSRKSSWNCIIATH